MKFLFFFLFATLPALHNLSLAITPYLSHFFPPPLILYTLLEVPHFSNLTLSFMSLADVILSLTLLLFQFHCKLQARLDIPCTEISSSIVFTQSLPSLLTIFFLTCEISFSCLYCRCFLSYCHTTPCLAAGHLLMPVLFVLVLPRPLWWPS